MRSVLHIRICSFPAAVERKRRPELAGRPVIVGRLKGNTSGVVVSAGMDAMKLGVEEGMSVRQARRSCPDAVVIMADYAAYRQVSEQFLDILAQYSPLVEPDSLGSAYMDVTGSRSLFGDVREIAGRIAFEASERVGLPVAIGCASNKLVARLVSSAGKRFIEVTPGAESEFMSPLPVGELGAVSGKMAKRLGELGVSNIGQLAMIPERLLIRQFGPVGSIIRRQSLGGDASQVRAAYPYDVVVGEHMFDNALEEPAQVEQHLGKMVGEALVSLGRKNALAGEITLTLIIDRTPGVPGVSGIYSRNEPTPGTLCFGTSFSSRSRLLETPDHQEAAYFRFKKPTDSISIMMQAFAKLLSTKMEPGMQISGARVTFSDLTPGEGSQLCLIGAGERKRRLGRAVELVRERFGDGAVVFALSLAA